jgi:hypothetical protein
VIVAEPVNGTVTLPALILATEPLALNVPVSGELPASVRLAGPENTAVPDTVTEAFVTVNVKLSPSAVPETEKLSVPPESRGPVSPDVGTVELV